MTISNSKDDTGRKRRSPRGVPDFPDDWDHKETEERNLETLEYIQKIIDKVQDVYSSIIANGIPGVSSLVTVIENTMGFDGKWVKKNLDIIILQNLYNSRKFTPDTKMLYTYLVVLNKCYIANKQLFDNVDVMKVLVGGRKALLGYFNILESLSCKEEQRQISAIRGVLYDYRRFPCQTHGLKSLYNRLSDSQRRLLDECGSTIGMWNANGESAEVEDDETDPDDSLDLFETYKFTEECFDGFMLACERYESELSHIDRAIVASVDFSFAKLNDYIENMIWMLEGLFDRVSESAIRGRVTAKQRNEFDSAPKIFNDRMLREIYSVVNGEIFEAIPYDYFCNSINSPARPTHLVVMPQQIKKVCFLVARLAYSLPHEDRDAWIKSLIESVGINEKTYKAKRRSCVGADSTESDKLYVDKLNRIAKKYKVQID